MDSNRRAVADLPDGETRKTMMKMHRIAPSARVKGFVFLRRTAPMGRAMRVVLMRLRRGEVFGYARECDSTSYRKEVVGIKLNVEAGSRCAARDTSGIS